MMGILYGADRQQVRDIEGTPIFTARNPELTANAIWTYDFESDASTSKKYLPFNEFTIQNNGEDAVKFYINQDKNNYKIILKGTIVTISGKALFSFRVENIGTTTITANKIDVSCERTGMTSDEFSKAISKNVFTSAFLRGVI
jgi:hypothetical protein